MSETKLVETTSVATTVSITSSDTFGRMIASMRTNHMVIDAPDYAGGPGDAPIPPELFLSSIGSCAIGILTIVAAAQEIPLTKSSVSLLSEFNPQEQNDRGVTILQKVELNFELEGVSQKQGQILIDVFCTACPLYGSIKMSAESVSVNFKVR